MNFRLHVLIRCYSRTMVKVLSKWMKGNIFSSEASAQYWVLVVELSNWICDLAKIKINSNIEVEIFLIHHFKKLKFKFTSNNFYLMQGLIELENPD